MPGLKLFYLFTIAVAFVLSLTEGHRHRPSVRRLSYLLGYMLISEVTGYILDERDINKNFLHYVYTPVEVLFLCQLYADHYTSKRVSSWTKILGWSFLGFSIVFSVSSWIDSQLQKSPTVLILSEWVLGIGLVLYYFYDLYRNDYLVSLPRQPVFWISVGNFLFYSGTFFLMGLISELRRLDDDRADQLFTINTFLNILMYLLWGVGFLCLRINRSSSTSS